MTEPSAPAAALEGHRRYGEAATASETVSASTLELVAELEGLRTRLASQPVIEQSKGILMGHYRIGPDAAFEVLRRWSSHTNCKVRIICDMIVTAAGHTGAADSAHPDLLHLINDLNQGHIPEHRP